MSITEAAGAAVAVRAAAAVLATHAVKDVGGDGDRGGGKGVGRDGDSGAATASAGLETVAVSAVVV